jgi:hypothetical protein
VRVGATPKLLAALVLLAPLNYAPRLILSFPEKLNPKTTQGFT